MVENIGPVQSPSPVEPISPKPGSPAGEAGGKVSFKEILKKSIQEVSKLQHEADEAIQELATGKREDYAQVITAVQKADIAFRTLMQVRNKLIDAYQEFNRMRV